MGNLAQIIQSILFWLFMAGVGLDVLLVLARVFIKDPAVEKKRTYLFYCSLGLTMISLFLISLLEFLNVRFQDESVWNMVVILSGAGTVIMGFFIFGYYPELWLQKTKKKGRS